MLIELVIQDLALIERTSLSFGAGLNVITGETGAGKSLLIDALELLLGQRARSGLVRRGAQKAVVEGCFAVRPTGYGELVREWLRANLPEALDDATSADGELELILTRTVGRDGRTRAHVNHRPVTQRVLRELAGHLVEIHGQNDHQKLFDTTEQLRLVDTFGELSDNLAGYRERREAWTALADRLDGFELDEGERLQRIDWLRFQADELRAAELDAGELQELRSERELLRNAGQLATQVGGVLMDLTERDDAVLTGLQRAERIVGEWAERLDALAPAAEELRNAVASAESAIVDVRSFVDGVESDPMRLESVEERLSTYEELQHKYRLDVAGLVARLGEIEDELEGLEGRSADREDVGRECARAFESMAESAGRLTKARKRLRARLKQAVEQGLADLGLERARFEVALAERKLDAESGEGGARDAERKRFGPFGTDALEFLLAANPGEPEQPLRKVASGGEMARIMLALRGALAVKQSTPTLIFDEVDTGVGGRLGPKVGEHLGALAAHHQILCVTHLPGIAARAHSHLRVQKSVDKGRTRTSVEELSGDDRVNEIAEMISGGADHETARAEARRLLAAGE